MKLFKYDSEQISCTTCRYAKVFIPSFAERWIAPKCEKGHGTCSETKICGDYKPVWFKTCPKCNHELLDKGDKYVCSECGAEFKKVNRG